jgi:hypothetical protein
VFICVHLWLTGGYLSAVMPPPEGFRSALIFRVSMVFWK